MIFSNLLKNQYKRQQDVEINVQNIPSFNTASRLGCDDVAGKRLEWLKVEFRGEGRG